MSDVIDGRYKIGKILGRGSYAVVRECTDQQTGDTYAMKILDKAQVVSGGLQEQLRREITTMLQLDHPNILQLHKFLQGRKFIYLLLEKASGGELFEYMETLKSSGTSGVPEPQARTYFKQLIAAIQYCHEQGIAHRDIKPQNLLLTENKQVLKVSDFGLANHQRTTQSGKINASMLLQTRCGTPQYMAPEVLQRNKGGYDGRAADMWSCGVVLYHLVCGCLPFTDNSLPGLFAKINKGQYSIPDTLSAECKELIAGLMCHSVDNRFTSDQVWNHTWLWGNEAPPPMVSAANQKDLVLTDVSNSMRDLDVEEENTNLYTEQASNEKLATPPVVTATAPTPKNANSQPSSPATPPVPQNLNATSQQSTATTNSTTSSCDGTEGKQKKEKKGIMGKVKKMFGSSSKSSSSKNSL